MAGVITVTSLIGGSWRRAPSSLIKTAPASAASSRRTAERRKGRIINAALKRARIAQAETA
jgi:hypothetical protein